MDSEAIRSKWKTKHYLPRIIQEDGRVARAIWLMVQHRLCKVRFEEKAKPCLILVGVLSLKVDPAVRCTRRGTAWTVCNGGITLETAAASQQSPRSLELARKHAASLLPIPAQPLHATCMHGRTQSEPL